MKTANNKMLSVLVGAVILSFASIPQVNAADFAGSYKGTITKQDLLPIVDNGKHVINVTVEADAFCGPLLAQRADGLISAP